MNRMRSGGDINLPKVAMSPDLKDGLNEVEIRVGMVNYINTALIYEPWKERSEIPGCHVLEAPPSTLNRFLADGDIDLGFVSCFEYAKHPHLYRILPDLSISANGPVGSVFLFSKLPVDELDSQKVLLSSQSETSAALTKIVLEEFYTVSPEYCSGEVTGDRIDDCKALLAIGDDALRLRKQGGFLLQLDLGELWKQQTGLPFVFAVCAVREEFCREKPEQLASVYNRLVDCRQEGGRRMMEICEKVAPRIPMEVSDCYSYLKGIEHDLGPLKRQALEKYFNYLIAREEVGAAALPLKIHQFAPEQLAAAPL